MRKLKVLGIVFACVHGLLWPLASPASDVYVLQTGHVLPDGNRQLVPGVDENNGGRFVASTIGLVIAKNPGGQPIKNAAGKPIVIVADPGFGSDEQSLSNALDSAQAGLTLGDITHVFIGHHHPDHTLNAGLFPNATLVDFWATYKDGLWEDHPDGYEIAPGIKVLRTPGHTDEDASLVVETAAPGKKVAVFTHVWWFYSEGPPFGVGPAPDQDPIAKDQTLLDASRTLITDASEEAADCIIPGHGEPFDPTDPVSGAGCDMVGIVVP